MCHIAFAMSLAASSLTDAEVLERVDQALDAVFPEFYSVVRKILTEYASGLSDIKAATANENAAKLGPVDEDKFIPPPRSKSAPASLNKLVADPTTPEHSDLIQLKNSPPSTDAKLIRKYQRSLVKNSDTTSSSNDLLLAAKPTVSKNKSLYVMEPIPIEPKGSSEVIIHTQVVPKRSSIPMFGDVTTVKKVDRKETNITADESSVGIISKPAVPTRITKTQETNEIDKSGLQSAYVNIESPSMATNKDSMKPTTTSSTIEITDRKDHQKIDVIPESKFEDSYEVIDKHPPGYPTTTDIPSHSVINSPIGSLESDPSSTSTNYTTANDASFFSAKEEYDTDNSSLRPASQTTIVITPDTGEQIAEDAAPAAPTVVSDEPVLIVSEPLLQPPKRSRKKRQECKTAIELVESGSKLNDDDFLTHVKKYLNENENDKAKQDCQLCLNNLCGPVYFACPEVANEVMKHIFCHFKEEMYHCDNCDFTNSKETFLLRHIRQKHGPGFLNDFKILSENYKEELKLLLEECFPVSLIKFKPRVPPRPKRRSRTPVSITGPQTADTLLGSNNIDNIAVDRTVLIQDANDGTSSLSRNTNTEKSVQTVSRITDYQKSLEDSQSYVIL